MKLCEFCSEQEATKVIANPNIGDAFIGWWDVCDFCADFIKEKQTEHIKEIIKIKHDAIHAEEVK